MSERYTRIFALERRLYTREAPVLIAAGALLLDGYGSRLVCQLKLHNLQERPIRMARVAVTMLDGVGAPLGDAVEHKYLDLHAGRDDCFGQNTAIVIPNAAARSFTARVTEVVFDDGTLWAPERSGPWTPLKPQLSLQDYYEDAELALQYQIRYGADCRYAYEEDGGLWFCTCGKVNHKAENSCHGCRRVRAALRDVSAETLRKECASRLKGEEERRAEAEAEAKVKNKKRLIAAAIALPVLILAVALLATLPKAHAQARAYEQATTLLGMGYYEEAAQAFTALGDYKDSAEQAEKNVPYTRAWAIMGSARANDSSALLQAGRSRTELNEETNAAMLLYETAAEMFEALGDYKDSPQLAKQCREGIVQARQTLFQDAYDQAEALLTKGSYSAAREAFLALGSYGDSADMAQEAVYQKAAALAEFVARYDVRSIYASISLSPDTMTMFSLPKAAALELGSQCVADLRAACGEDMVDVTLADSPAEGLLPLGDAVCGLFETLGDYKDSAEQLTRVEELTDYTRDFYMLCEAGDMAGAYDWLKEYEGEFANRDAWLQALELYMPYCGSWSLYLGDSTLVPYTVGRGGACYRFSSRVILLDATATLRFTVSGDEEYILDYTADWGSVNFLRYDDRGASYTAVIGVTGHLVYMCYSGNGTLRSSCEYERA